jgi:hypothetical protein
VASYGRQGHGLSPSSQCSPSWCTSFGPSFEGVNAGQKLVRDATERVDVVQRIGRLILQCLGTGVRRIAHIELLLQRLSYWFLGGSLAAGLQISRRDFRAASLHSAGVPVAAEFGGGEPVVDSVGGGASVLCSEQLPTLRPSASRAHFPAPPSCDKVSGGGLELEELASGGKVVVASARRVRSVEESEPDDELELAASPVRGPVVGSDRTLPAQPVRATPSAAVTAIQHVFVMAQLRGWGLVAFARTPQLAMCIPKEIQRLVEPPPLAQPDSAAEHKPRRIPVG